MEAWSFYALEGGLEAVQQTGTVEFTRDLITRPCCKPGLYFTCNGKTRKSNQGYVPFFRHGISKG